MSKRAKKTATDRLLAQQRENIHGLIKLAGSQQELGETLGVSQAAVSKWLLRGWMPLKRAAEVEATYGVPRTKLADPRVVSLLTPSDSLLQTA